MKEQQRAPPANAVESHTLNPIFAAIKPETVETQQEASPGSQLSPSVPIKSTSVVPDNPEPAGSDKSGSSLVANPPYCVGNTIYSLCLLAAIFVTTSTHFTFHCTPLLDVMGDESGAREWCGVSPTVQIFSWLLLLPALLNVVVAFGRMSCFSRRTIRRARANVRREPAGHVGNAKTICSALSRWQRIIRGPSSSHYIQMMFVFELKETVVQALAVDQMSRTGIQRVPLTLITAVILLNGLSSFFAMTWVVNRINRNDSVLRKRQEASKWLSRLLLFDATCDLFYTSFGLAHLVISYSRVFGLIHSEEAEKMRSYAQTAQGKGAEVDFGDMKAFAIVSEAQSTLFGGTDAGEIVIKLLSRVLPLLQAPLRVMTAFRIRHSRSAGTPSAYRVKAAEDVPQADRGRRRPRIRFAIRRWLISSVRRTRTLDGNYKPVPLWAAGLHLVAVAAFALSVFITLWTWPDCSIPEVEEACAIRAFPVFATYSNADEWACRSCACSTMFYLSNTNCSADEKQQRAPMSACQAPADDGLLRSAGAILNSSAILGPLRGGFFLACPQDTGLLTALASHTDQLGVLRIDIIPGDDDAIFDSAEIPDVAALARRHPIKWQFPPTFGCRSSNRQYAWPLTYLRIADSAAAAYDVTVDTLPSALWHMTGLREVRLIQLGLTYLPTEIGDLQSLRHLSLQHNELTSFPTSLARLGGSLRNLNLVGNALSSSEAVEGIWTLTGLMYLNIGFNPLPTIPSGMWRLSKLTTLTAEGSQISAVPSDIGRLTKLRHLRLAFNKLISLPSTLTELVSLKSLALQGNMIHRLPHDLGRLTNLQDLLNVKRNRLFEVPDSLGELSNLKNLHLDSNFISSVPSCIKRLSNLHMLSLSNNSLFELPEWLFELPLSSLNKPDFYFRLDAEANNISDTALRRATHMLTATSTASSLTSWPPFLALLGRNPACESGDGSLVSNDTTTRAGAWQIKCLRECAVGCLDTGIRKSPDSWLLESRIRKSPDSWLLVSRTEEAINTGRCSHDCDWAACKSGGRAKAFCFDRDVEARRAARGER